MYKLLIKPGLWRSVIWSFKHFTYNFALQLYWNRTFTWLFSCKFAAYFHNTFLKNTSGWLPLYLISYLLFVQETWNFHKKSSSEKKFSCSIASFLLYDLLRKCNTLTPHLKIWPSKHLSWWRRLSFSSSKDVFKTSWWRPIPANICWSSRRLEDVFKTCLEDVFNTSSA